MKSCIHILLLLASLLGLGCPGPEEVPTYYVSPEFLSYCNFQSGSYWIYDLENSPSIQDCVYVTVSGNRVQTGSGQPVFYYEFFFYEYFVRDIKYAIGIYPGVLSGGSEVMMERDTNFSHGIVHFFQNADTFGQGESAITGRFDTVWINQQPFMDVIQITHLHNTYRNPTRELFFAKNVGIIRRTFWDGTTWILKRYSVKQ